MTKPSAEKAEYLAWKRDVWRIIKCPFYRQIASSVSISCENPVWPGKERSSCQITFARFKELRRWVESSCTSYKAGSSCPIAAALNRYYAGEDVPTMHALKKETD